MVLKWERGHIRTKLSSKALQGGRDADGSILYVGRAMHNGVFLPAKIIPSKQAAYVSYNGLEVLVENFEVLAAKEDKFTWEPASHGQLKPGAVATGREGNDEIYVGRAPFQGSMTIGKIHPSHRCIYIPFGGKEQRIEHYEVLVYKKPKLQWVPTTSRAPMPKDAVLGGRDTDGSLIYVGRASHEGEMIPAKVLPQKQAAYVCHNGLEISKQSFEVLVGDGVQWKKERDGKIPKGAYPAGTTRTGEVLYVARVEHNRSVTVGKLHPSHGSLYIPYGGKELAFKQYEVLTGI